MLSNLGLLSSSQSLGWLECWVVWLKVMLQNPQHEIANSIFNLIQRTGSGPLICNTDLGRAPTFVTLQMHTNKMYEQLEPS